MLFCFAKDTHARMAYSLETFGVIFSYWEFSCCRVILACVVNLIR